MQNDRSRKILWDENHNVQFDFSNAVSVFEPHNLANMYSEYLSDVDVVIEDQEKLICLEYKNANVKNANNTDAFKQKIDTEEFWKKIAKKYYGTMFLVWACNKNQTDKVVQYVLLIECNPGFDDALKKRFVMKMMCQLPFKYNSQSQIHKRVIDDFCLMDLKEWRVRYPQFPIYDTEFSKV